MTEATDQRKPSIYVSNRMRGVVRYNFPWFDATRDHLDSLGWNVISPADIDRANGFDAMTREFHDDFDWGDMPQGFDDYETILLRDIDAIQTCDAIFMGRDWEQSCGANRELAEARKLGLREFYEDVCASPSPDVMKTGAIYDKWATEIRENTARVTEQMREHIDAILQTPPESIGCSMADDVHVVDPLLQAMRDFEKACDDVTGIPPAPTETRITDPVTGGQKGSKPAMFALIPSESLWELAELYGYGAAKYDPDNWRRGYSWRLSFSALMRHLWAFWRGEDRDPESGFKHLTHAAWHCLTLAWFMDNRRSHDDRPKAEVAT